MLTDKVLHYASMYGNSMVLSFSGGQLKVSLNDIQKFGPSSLYRLSHVEQYQVPLGFLLILAHSKCHQPIEQFALSQ